MTTGCAWAMFMRLQPPALQNTSTSSRLRAYGLRLGPSSVPQLPRCRHAEIPLRGLQARTERRNAPPAAALARFVLRRRDVLLGRARSHSALAHARAPRCEPAWPTRVGSARCGSPDPARWRRGRGASPRRRCGSRRTAYPRGTRRDLGYVVRALRGAPGIGRRVPATAPACSTSSTQCIPTSRTGTSRCSGPIRCSSAPVPALLSWNHARALRRRGPARVPRDAEGSEPGVVRALRVRRRRTDRGRRGPADLDDATRTRAPRRRTRLQLRHAEPDHGDARDRAPDRAGADGLHRPGPARVGGLERRRDRDHRDVVGAARRGARRDPQDARSHRQAVRREHRAAVRARREHRRLRRRERRDVRDDVGRRSDEVHASC